MAVNQQRQPLLLSYGLAADLLVYGVHLESVSSAPEIRLSPDPIVRFVKDDAVDAIAVSGGGGTLITLRRNSRDTAVLDMVTQGSAPGPQLREPKRRPVMLPVGDDTVIVMDTIFQGGRCCYFEALRRVPGGWRADPLPNPPPLLKLLEQDYNEDWHVDLPAVGTYFVSGTRVWISMFMDSGGDDDDDIGATYSLDTTEEREAGTCWREEGPWELPLQGSSLFVPELNLVFGFSSLPLVGGCTGDMKPECEYLCALDVEARPPVVRRMWEFPEDTTSLAHLGNGRFCIAGSVNVERSAMISPWCNGKGTSFVLVDVTRDQLHLQLTTCGRPHIHQWGWPYENYGDANFI